MTESTTESVKPSSEGRKKIITGEVVSNKTDQTIVVKTERQISHPLYKKYYKQSNKVTAHDPKNDCGIGDKVKVIESKPISKTKRWTLLEVLERAK